ncbi:amidase domain-containing protein [Cytobacillus sp. IB215665]|uniref:amidase domain-containing protein n=1 Tax=Cytobacillus sp. IB215665 TaxID=3097357 RepID=UPI002A1374FD|nr:amidase domain-containing protein [Cytobacillus sp. IB215665]MDX8368045.1 amidase domain-containing protein [Cytobacillus sp. IB215665]
MKRSIHLLVKDRIDCYVNKNSTKFNVLSEREQQALKRKQALCNKRSVEVLKCNVKGKILGKKQIAGSTSINYVLHYRSLMKQGDFFYIEEICEHRIASFLLNELINDFEDNNFVSKQEHVPLDRNHSDATRKTFQYDRLEAVRYAETWWNSYNVKYKKFEVDCTNFVSQCLHAGGAPLVGYPNRSNGWWMAGNSWSYSWSVAHSLRWYLSGANAGLRAVEVESAKDLSQGDIICYDFEGDGKFDHTTIVVAKDKESYPLVNAHTENSRMRYWSYEDSTAYTPNIKYKFFHIVGDS